MSTFSLGLSATLEFVVLWVCLLVFSIQLAAMRNN